MRVAAGLIPAALGARTGIPRWAVSMYERGPGHDAIGEQEWRRARPDIGAESFLNP